MTWQDWALPVVSSSVLMVASYLIGAWGYSIAWIGVMAALYLLKTRHWLSRQETRLKMRKQILTDRGLIKAIGNDMPSWLRDPSTERVEWVNLVSCFSIQVLSAYHCLLASDAPTHVAIHSVRLMASIHRADKCLV